MSVAETTYCSPTPGGPHIERWARAAGLKPSPQLAQFARWAADWGGGEGWRQARQAEAEEGIYPYSDADKRPIARARAAAAEIEGQEVSPEVSAPWITGQDKEILDCYYRAERSEGGSADEVILRGLKAVLARFGGGEQFSLTLTLEMIALVAHGGGLIEFSDQHKALAEIRNLSQPWLGNQIDSLQRKEAARFGGGEV